MGQVYSGAGEKAFVQWDRDSVSDCCSYCSTAFTTFNRRHHCRSCGVLICHDCSPYTAWLPQLGYDPDVPQRVCSFCATKGLNVTELEMEAYNLCQSKLWKEESPSLDRISSVFAAAKAMSSFNSYLLDKLRTQFAILAKVEVSNCVYVLSNTESFSDLKATVGECSRVQGICSQFKDDLEIDLSQLIYSLDASKKRILKMSQPKSPAATAAPAVSRRRQSSPVIRVKKVRFAPLEVSAHTPAPASTHPGRIRAKSRLQQRISMGVPQSVHTRTSPIVC